MLVHARSYRHEPVALGTVEAGGVAQVCVVRGTAHLLWICLPQLTLFTGDGVQTDTQRAVTVQTVLACHFPDLA